MNRKISDLMDYVQDDQVSVERRTPLSNCRIRERVMEEIQIKKHVNLRWLGKVAVAVAVLMTLTITVFATDAVLGEGKLIKTFLGKELTGKQQDVVNDMKLDFGGAITSNGATITPISGFSEGNVLNFHMRVEAPEGVLLPDLSEEDGYYYDIEPSFHLYFESRNPWYNPERWHLWANGIYHSNKTLRGGSSHTVIPHDDPNPNDNVKEFTIRFYGSGCYAKFTGSWDNHVSIYGLFIRKRMDTYSEKLFHGIFEFRPGGPYEDIDYSNQSIVLDFEDITIYNQEYDFYTTVKKITLTPMMMRVAFDSTEIDTKYIFARGGPIQLVMKDGTVVDVVPAYENVLEQNKYHPDSIIGVTGVCWFDDVLVLDDIDYVLIGREHQVDVN